RFRRDLFYRISGITVVIPPLRQRPRDLPGLIAAEIELANRDQGKQIVGLSRPAADTLLAHSWPGNLRELRRVLHAAWAFAEVDFIPEEAILLGAVDASPLDRPEHAPSSAAPEIVPSLRALVLAHIRRVLEQTHGNKRAAAKILGLSRSTLERKLRP